MFLKEIIIEGFKSYAQTTTINMFDPHFNAITGLNGSGKSNILDSICFVLGITNLSQVRATNLQELIYKGGNAGITKATVSLTFDNSDKASSPLGYNDYEEITITRQISTGGKHKYLINGQNATAQRVSDLFGSVQLNVNNPNFLIMQGKITKVLNMKPIEILSMIEEAAGTKTYDIKKSNALLTIDKKNTKLNEIERVLRDDITPMIEKLKQERSAYIEYQKCEREYLHLHKISIAFKYCQNEEALHKIESESVNIERTLESKQARIREIESLIEQLKQEIKLAKKNMDNGDTGLIDCEAELKEHHLVVTKLKSELSHIESNIKAERKRLGQQEKSISESKQAIEAKEKKLAELTTRSETSNQAREKVVTELQNAENDYQTLCCGFSLDDQNLLGSIQDQLINIGNKISDVTSRIKQAELKLQSDTVESKKLSSQITSSGKDYDEKLATLETIRTQHNTVSKKLDTLGFSNVQFEQTLLEKRELSVRLNTSNEKVEQFYSKYPQVNAEFKLNQPNFDNSKIKGLVCSLFTVKDARYMTALETAAGGKLYNLVVDSDQTGKMLLESGELKRKITIIPMNKIKSNKISDRTVQTAKELVGADSVHSALSLISYSREYQDVMEYVFGTKLVCISLDTAKKVAFHPQIMTSTITLDGDHFDPEGILTGGSKTERGQFLARYFEFKTELVELNEIKSNMNQVEVELNNQKQKSSEYTRLKRELDELLNRMKSAETNLEQTSHHQMLEKVNVLAERIKEKKNEIENLNAELETSKTKQSELSTKINSQGANRAEEKEKLQRLIEEKKKIVEKHSKAFNEFKKEYDTIRLEIEALAKETELQKDDLQKIDECIEKLNKDKKVLDEKLLEMEKHEASIQVKIDERRAILREKCEAINSKQGECDAMDKEKNAAELQIKEMGHKQNDLEEQLAASSRQVKQLLEANPWIEEEKQSFGVENTVYDFSKYNIKEILYRLTDIKNRKEKLSKQVDMRAMGLLTKKEEEYEELNKKRIIVLKDKTTLESTIEDLEKIKCEVLHKAFESINKNFGNIFKTLLPGASSKLEFCNKNSLLDGVEFKVAFGDVWKESLNELSGGQRSLVALSLILSLLLFNPAPLYILDEVDAALDTSHTQNIGLMIKKYFKTSQFIIVSLKDGMFNNANVLFRTKLVDGISTIQRYEQKKKNAERNI